MPELPEVETLRTELNRAVKGKTIKTVLVKVPKMVKPLTPAKFQQQIKNKKILDVSRRAKILILKLTSDLFLTIHPKLTGQLIFQPKKGRAVIGGHPQKGGTENLPNKFTHAIFQFSDGSKLFFNDLRKFGWMRLADKQQVDKLISEFGPEPLSRDFNLGKFTEIIKKYPNRNVKQILMDQTLIAGVGNIYADESLFCAGILPTRLSKKIKTDEVKKLYQCIIKILKFAIAKKGTSANTYIQLDGKPGGMEPYLKVYGRNKEKCKKCGNPIQKIQLNGRGTHFCKSCQQ
ncbi:MAG: DNA-formamidopyrimidine glycosylase [Candidatus Buchananbacteria bacterium RIFCSPHIGHO2_02_FULL_38_8]|uniref:DNA-formamidopyrimidine glycosylase n=2 Tax=Candidatus Buchananiibacteriota TaxID=1817903 RepID=A0A1G1Y171_9BACT|nr:MAG: DNA-formamidopyrimidine glycosylase [Candidatus Buchananbacteria bacterium RIFCSPHIGHO2_01_FULL_39_8]OGY47849.1 MAG: DNA-formamidopyrimidine glycosylase [Candidatus Buchananbacteria bacterium RIFCSPHIGHO2_02_FULL_38_8]